MIRAIVLRASCALLCLTVPASALQVTSLVAHWDMNEPSGTTLQDSSGGGFDATIQGGVTLGLPGPVSATNLAAGFDSTTSGMAQFADAPPLSSLNADLSVAAWVFVDAAAGGGPRRIFGSNVSAWSFGLTPNGLRFTTVGILDYDLAATYPIGQWFHVAAVFDAAFDVTFYIDGVNVGTVAGGAPANGSSGQWLIGSWNGTIEFWHGRIDELQVYAGSLTQAEVQFLFANHGATASPASGNAYCFGDPTNAACPCANFGATGEGCAHSGGVGAKLAGNGSASLTADDLTFTGSQLVPGRTAVLFAAHNAVGSGAGVAFGDGLRCAGGTAVRLGVRTVDGAGSATWGPALAGTGGWSAGDTRRFQIWYQDDPSTTPCGAGFNLSQALELSFTL